MINFHFHKRTFVKGLTWECSGLISLFIVAYAFGLADAFTASIFTISYTALRVCMFYLHERIWKRIFWGKQPLNEKDDEC